MKIDENSKNNMNKSPLPYQVLTCLGEYFLYSTSLNQFFKIDYPTYVFFKLHLQYSFSETKRLLSEQKLFPANIVDEVSNDVSEIINKGILRIPKFSISDSEFKRQLDHRYTVPWNKLELALTEKCNLACLYCYCSTCRDIPEKGTMSTEVARKAISWLFSVCGNSETVSITFFGGEPLLNKEVLFFAVNYSQELAKRYSKKIFYSMTTNGTLLDNDIISIIKRYNFGLMVSLDGPADIHNRQCPTSTGQGSYDLATTGIKKLMARRRAVTVRCTMTHPIPRMLDLISFFENFGFTRIVLGRTVNPVNASPVDFTEEDFIEALRQEREEIIPWILDKLAKGQKPKYFPYAKFLADQEKGGSSITCSPFRCGACRGTTTVSGDGTLYPCHRFVGMQAWKLGNIQNGPNIDRCKKFWSDYRKAIMGKCDSCWMWNLCHGPCPWEIAQADGTFNLSLDKCKRQGEFFANAAYVYDKSIQFKNQRKQ